jgi:hypothetical protein
MWRGPLAYGQAGATRIFCGDWDRTCSFEGRRRSTDDTSGRDADRAERGGKREQQEHERRRSLRHVRGCEHERRMHATHELANRRDDRRFRAPDERRHRDRRSRGPPDARHSA